MLKVITDHTHALDEELAFKFQEVDKRFDKTRPVVEYYAKKYEIEDLDHTDLT